MVCSSSEQYFYDNLKVMHTSTTAHSIVSTLFPFLVILIKSLLRVSPITDGTTNVRSLGLTPKDILDGLRPARNVTFLRRGHLNNYLIHSFGKAREKKRKCIELRSLDFSLNIRFANETCQKNKIDSSPLKRIFFMRESSLQLNFVILAASLDGRLCDSFLKRYK